MESSFVLVSEGGMVGGDQFRNQPRRGNGEGKEENCHHAVSESSQSTKSGRRKNYLPTVTICPEIVACVAGWDAIPTGW
jgi:hypothetical protein